MSTVTMLVKEIENMPDESVVKVLDFALFLKTQTNNNDKVSQKLENTERFPSMNKPVHLGFDLKKISRDELYAR